MKKTNNTNIQMFFRAFFLTFFLSFTFFWTNKHTSIKSFFRFLLFFFRYFNWSTHYPFLTVAWSFFFFQYNTCSTGHCLYIISQLLSILFIIVILLLLFYFSLFSIQFTFFFFMCVCVSCSLYGCIRTGSIQAPPNFDQTTLCELNGEFCK